MQRMRKEAVPSCRFDNGRNCLMLQYHFVPSLLQDTFSIASLRMNNDRKKLVVAYSKALYSYLL
jgi:hypothetical protein